MIVKSVMSSASNAVIWLVGSMCIYLIALEYIGEKTPAIAATIAVLVAFMWSFRPRGTLSTRPIRGLVDKVLINLDKRLSDPKYMEQPCLMNLYINLNTFNLDGVVVDVPNVCDETLEADLFQLDMYRAALNMECRISLFRALANPEHRHAALVFVSILYKSMGRDFPVGEE